MEGIKPLSAPGAFEFVWIIVSNADIERIEAFLVGLRSANLYITTRVNFLREHYQLKPILLHARCNYTGK